MTKKELTLEVMRLKMLQIRRRDVRWIMMMHGSFGERGGYE